MDIKSLFKNHFLQQKYLFRIFYCLVFTLIFAIDSEASITSYPNTNSLTLQNIKATRTPSSDSFSDNLSIIPNFLKIGDSFDLNKVDEHFFDLKKQMRVVEVPQWLYGTWKSDKQVQDFAYIYGKGISTEAIEVDIKIYDVVGDIKSTEEKIYSIISPGTVSLVSRSQDINEYQISIKEDRSNDFISFICKDLSIRVQVDQQTKTILNIFQVESETTYRPTFKGNSIIADGWLKSFDENGIPVNFTHIRSQKQLVDKHKLIDLSDVDSEKAMKGDLD